MAAAQISQTMYRPLTNGTTSSHGSLGNRQSLSSFPSSRSPSEMSRNSRPSKLGRIDTDRSSRPQSAAHSKTSSIGQSSQHSSMSATRKPNPEAHSSRKLKSQYPRDDKENHVEYILVASFDIDKGPIMEHQYPVAITGDEHMLAELMLPDQAHVRNQDWTIFFLHKDTSQEEEEAEIKAEKKRRRQRRKDIEAGIVVADEEDEEDENDELSEGDSSSDESEPEGGEGPPLIYVLNLVNTKLDKSEKRGAVVKAMAICTRHPFLHIYKPLLLLALEEYFKAPHPETLASLYDAVNSMDLSLMPRLSILERNLLQASDNKDLFVEKFEKMIQMRMAEDRGEIPDQTQEAQSPETRADLTRIGTKAHVQGHSVYSVPRDTHEFETRVVYNGIPVPIKVPVAISPETVGDFSLIKLIQTFSDPHTKSPQPFTLHPHLTTGGAYTHPIIVLVNAMLSQKRVIFLGHNRPSGEVAEAVLAACALVSGSILRGFTRHAFPYTDLSKIDDLLKVPGFVAGVTNPTFENHPEWWDVLCDLPTGRMKISVKIESAPITEGLMYFQQQNPGFSTTSTVANSTGPSTSDPTGDAAFMADVLKSIAARHGEGVIRAKWREWVEKFTRVAAAFEESVYGASALYIGGEEADGGVTGVSGHGYVWCDDGAKQKELGGGVNRIEGWRNTRSYYSFIQDLAQLYASRPLKSLDLHHIHDRLRTQKLTPAASREIYLALCRTIHSYDEICQLLSVAPESRAGLFYIALGLFHKEKEVRLATIDLLERVSEHEAGRHWWTALSRFEKLAFIRIKREADGELKSIREGGSGGGLTASGGGGRSGSSGPATHSGLMNSSGGGRRPLAISRMS